jgi:hypothetical protein
MERSGGFKFEDEYERCPYWLLAIGYWLLAIGYWLLAIGYWRSAWVAGEKTWREVF